MGFIYYIVNKLLYKCYYRISYCVKSKNRIAQENEVLCKIIAYNITVLIHAMFELGITPTFLMSDEK